MKFTNKISLHLKWWFFQVSGRWASPWSLWGQGSWREDLRAVAVSTLLMQWGYIPSAPLQARNKRRLHIVALKDADLRHRDTVLTLVCQDLTWGCSTSKNIGWLRSRNALTVPRRTGWTRSCPHWCVAEQGHDVLALTTYKDQRLPLMWADLFKK